MIRNIILVIVWLAIAGLSMGMALDLWKRGRLTETPYWLMVIVSGGGAILYAGMHEWWPFAAVLGATFVNVMSIFGTRHMKRLVRRVQDAAQKAAYNDADRDENERVVCKHCGEAIERCVVEDCGLGRGWRHVFDLMHGCPQNKGWAEP